MAVTKNRMKAALAAGELQIGTWIMLVRNPAVLTLLKSVGLDYARLDLEHTSPSIETVADMAVLARALDFPLVVRPPQGSAEWITRLLDVGVWGLYIPHVDTPEVAYQVVRAALHAPAGMRSTFEPGPQNDYTAPGDPSASLEFLNDQVHITAMLESGEAFRHLDEIVGMPGIDAVGVGPADLAQDLGVYDTPDEARVIDEYRNRLIAAARKFRKPVSMGVWSLAEGERWIRAGVRIINYQTDATALRSTFEAAAKGLRRGD